MTEQTIITSDDLANFYKKSTQIKKLTAELDEIKKKIRASYEIGEYGAGDGLVLKVQNGGSTIDKNAFERDFPLSKNPRLYKTEVDSTRAKAILGADEIGPYLIPGTPRVSVDKLAVKK